MLLTLLSLALAGFTCRVTAAAGCLAHISTFLRSKWAPVTFGAITSGLMFWMLGTLRPIPFGSDGAAYLLQARIFAHFRWFAPPPPIPEFFEQFHVFVTPVFASKYPPGHSLLLVPGVWLGMPGLVPVLMTGLTGAFVFVLARRLSSEWVALLTWFLWSTSPGVLRFLPTYLSQTTTSALWLVGWWALLRWRADGRRRWLTLLGACGGWGAITHPYTWLLYAIPTGSVVLARVARRRSWRDLAWPATVAALCLGFLGLWDQRIVGSPFRLTWTEYAREYAPYDRLGFGVSSARPLRTLPPSMEEFADEHEAFHRGYTVGELPITAFRRIAVLGADFFGLNRLLLVPMLLIGFWGASAEFLFALVTCCVVIGGFLLYAHYPTWSLYYVELLPVFAYATALGLWRALTYFRSRPKSTLRQPNWREPACGTVLATFVFLLSMVPQEVGVLAAFRSRAASFLEDQRAFHSSMDKLPGRKLMVFVHYGAALESQKNLIVNSPHLANARAWIVRDRGFDNLRLIRLAPSRTPYLFDAATNTFARIDTSQLAASRTRLSGF